MIQFSPHHALPAHDILCWDGAPKSYRFVTVLQWDGAMCVIVNKDGSQEHANYAKLYILDDYEHTTLAFLIEMREDMQALQNNVIRYTAYAGPGDRLLTQQNIVMRHVFDALLRQSSV